MKWREHLQAAKQMGQRAIGIATTNTPEIIRSNWSKIQQIFQEQVGPAALAAAKNDESLEQLFEVVYEVLPLPLRMAVSRDRFIRYCFHNRDRLLPSAEVDALTDATVDEQTEATNEG